LIEPRVKCRPTSGFSHCNRRFRKTFQIGQSSPAAACPATYRPYAVDTPLSAPTASTSRHALSGCLRRDLHSLRALHFAPPLPQRALPRFGELFRPLQRASGQASPPNAPSKLPLPRRHLLSHYRAQVRRHCRAPSRSPSPEFRPSSPATWPGLSAPPFPSILVPIAFPWLTDTQREPQPGQHRPCTPVYRPQRRRAAIPDDEHPRVQ